MSLWRDELKPTAATSRRLVALAAIARRELEPRDRARLHPLWAIAAVAHRRRVRASLRHAFARRRFRTARLLARILTLPVAVRPRQRRRTVSRRRTAFEAVRKLIARASQGDREVDATGSGRTEVPRPRLARLPAARLPRRGVGRRPKSGRRRRLGARASSRSPGRSARDRDATSYAILAVAATVCVLPVGGPASHRALGRRAHRDPGWLGLPTLGAACAVALGAPLVLGETPILKLDSAIRPRVVIIKPLSDIKRQLKVDPPLEVMRVNARSSDVLAPHGTRRATTDASGCSKRVRATSATVSSPPAEPPTTGEEIEQSYRLTSLLSPWLPAAYAATCGRHERTGADRPGIADAPAARQDAARTHVHGHVTPAARDAEPRSRAPVTPKDGYAKFFGGLARPLVGGARTPLDIARKLEAHFRTYRYDEDVAAGHTVARLQQFLREKRRILRAVRRRDDVDAARRRRRRARRRRFPPRREQQRRVRRVDTRCARVGRSRRSRGPDGRSSIRHPDAAAARPSRPSCRSRRRNRSPSRRSPPSPIRRPNRRTCPRTSPRRAKGFHIPAGVIPALIVLALLAITPVTKWRRASTRRRAPPVPSVVGAFAELVDLARDLGVRTRPSETQKEFVARLLPRDEHASSLAQHTLRALYGPDAPSTANATEAWNASKAACTRLRKMHPWWRQALAFENPRSLLPDHALRRARTRVVTAFGRA